MSDGSRVGPRDDRPIHSGGPGTMRRVFGRLGIAMTGDRIPAMDVEARIPIRGTAQLLLRVMLRDSGGHPVCGDGDCMLGVRLPVDIVPDIMGNVSPGHGGMSVTPGDPSRLPLHFRPVAFGGIGKLPVFGIEGDDLGLLLRYRSDPRRPQRHGFVEPASSMPLEAYRAALRGTASKWRLVA